MAAGNCFHKQATDLKGNRINVSATGAALYLGKNMKSEGLYG